MGPAKEVFENPLHAYTKALISAIPVPDPSVQREKIIIPGDIPSPINPPDGCAYGHRTCSIDTRKVFLNHPNGNNSAKIIGFLNVLVVLGIIFDFSTVQKRLAANIKVPLITFALRKMFIPSKRLLFTILPFILIGFLRGQNPADMPLRQVIELAQDMIGKGDFAGASPMLDELEVRFEDEKDPAVEKILQQFGFVRGIGYLQSFAKSANKEFIVKAASAFGFFAEKFPNDPKAVMAMQKRTDCLRSLQEWREAARVIETLLDPKQPYRAKILKRSELLNLYYGKAQCYHIEQDWTKGEPAFRELLKFADAAKDEDRASYAVSCLTEMFVQNKRIDEVFPYLPRLSGDTPARYDLRLNVNLMQGAEQLAKQERFVEASLFYSLTMTTEEIVAYYSERQKEIKFRT